MISHTARRRRGLVQIQLQGTARYCDHQFIWRWCKWGLPREEIMCKAGKAESLSEQKALRYGVAIKAGQKGNPLNIVRRWLGHGRIGPTAICANALIMHINANRYTVVRSEPRHRSLFKKRSIIQAFRQK